MVLLMNPLYRSVQIVTRLTDRAVQNLLRWAATERYKRRSMTITLITGANKGIGFETARQLIDLGHTVYVGARDAERGERAAAELGARFVQLDVTDDASVERALAAIEAAEGRLDVLVHNAGVLE